MNISEYKGIIFVEDKLSNHSKHEESINVQISGLGSQLKSLNDLKEKFYLKIADSNNGYNVVCQFKYGQKQNIMAFDDISFYGSGILLKVGKDEYEKLLIKCKSQGKIELLYKVLNERIAINKPVQIDKTALYKYQDQYIGQILLHNLSDCIVKKVVIDVTIYNLEGEKINNREVVIAREYSDSQTKFGDNSKLIFNENNISSFSCEIKEVETNESVIIDYKDAIYKLYDRTSLLFSKYPLSKNQIEFLKQSYSFDISEDSILPMYENGILIDTKGDMEKCNHNKYDEFIKYLQSNKILEDISIKNMSQLEYTFSKFYLTLLILNIIVILAIMLSVFYLNVINYDNVSIIGSLSLILYIILGIVCDCYILNKTGLKQKMVITHFLLTICCIIVLMNSQTLLGLSILCISMILEISLFKNSKKKDKIEKGN